MGRSFLVLLVCGSVALMGVLGIHAHLPGDHAHTHGVVAEHEHAAPYAVAVLDADHAADHGEDGDIDIDPVVKAFGKLLLLATLVVALFSILCDFLTLATRGIVLRWPSAPPLRPPKDRTRFYILPPALAPPTPL